MNSDRDACGTDIWDSKDETLLSESTSIGPLKPYELYAVYVMGYMTSDATFTVMSNIHFFRTLASQPQPPQMTKIEPTLTTLTVEYASLSLSAVWT